MISLLFLLAQTGSFPSAMPPPSRMGENTRTLFSIDDYPKEAMKRGWEGTVVAEVTVSKEGMPSACRVIQSSGYQVLDSRTCEIMLTRARFIPAKDKDGNPVEDVVQTPPINWRLGR